MEQYSGKQSLCHLYAALHHSKGISGGCPRTCSGAVDGDGGDARAERDGAHHAAVHAPSAMLRGSSPVGTSSGTQPEQVH